MRFKRTDPSSNMYIFLKKGAMWRLSHRCPSGPNAWMFPPNEWIIVLHGYQSRVHGFTLHPHGYYTATTRNSGHTRKAVSARFSFRGHIISKQVELGLYNLIDSIHKTKDSATEIGTEQKLLKYQITVLCSSGFQMTPGKEYAVATAPLRDWLKILFNQWEANHLVRSIFLALWASCR